MLMQALRNGFLRVKRKSDLAGRGLPPVACNFFSFSLCFLFSSSSFMMTGLAASALDAILMSPPESKSQFWKYVSSYFIIPNQQTVQLPVAKAPGFQLTLCALLLFLCSSCRATGLYPWRRACDRKSPLGREK